VNSSSEILNSLNLSKVIVVGSGFYGLTVANLVASQLKLPVTILEARPMIGGNAYAYFDSETGIEVHKYGTHLFHTSSKKVWDYVNKFSEFTSYQHKVFTRHNGQLFTLPINLSTINSIYSQNLDPRSAKNLIDSEIKASKLSEGSESFESKALETIGTKLYESFIRGYTQKQWQTDPKQLPGFVFSRLPVRFNLNQNYFDDTYQGLPSSGYESLFKNMTKSPLIKVFCDSDYFEFADHIASLNTLLVFTGPIDRYFANKFGSLTWRTLDFEIETLEIDDFQGTSVINEADLDVPFTRTHEFKHLHPEWTYTPNKTIVMREFSRFASHDDDPYYPVNTSEDRLKLNSYRELAKQEKNTFFGGRLGSYQYLDMHMAIASAMMLFENELIERLT